MLAPATKHRAQVERFRVLFEEIRKQAQESAINFETSQTFKSTNQ